MSRIWEAIKQARLERSQEKDATAAPDGQAAGPLERRSRLRHAHQADLLVYGSGEDKQPFHEEGATVDASDYGCRLVLDTAVAPGQRLFLTNTGNQAEQECRVVHVSHREHGKIRVGVEFSQSARNFWNSSATQ
jgi:hypothetical protein